MRPSAETSPEKVSKLLIWLTYSYHHDIAMILTNCLGLPGLLSVLTRSVNEYTIVLTYLLSSGYFYHFENDRRHLPESNQAPFNEATRFTRGTQADIQELHLIAMEVSQKPEIPVSEMALTIPIVCSVAR